MAPTGEPRNRLMIPANSHRHRLAALSPVELERSRFAEERCSWVGCHREVGFDAAYAYVTRAGRLVEASRRLCEMHARLFARRYGLQNPR